MSLILDDIKYFIAASDSIKRLENKLGGVLFIRLKNGIQLTKLGEEFKRGSHRLLYEWEQLQNIANPESGLVQGSYTIALHASVALYALEYFMPQLQSDFPELGFNFIHGLSREMTEKVISWEADFGIVVNPIQHPDLVILKLATDEVSIFYAPHAPLKLIFDKKLIQAQDIIKKIGVKTGFKSLINSTSLEVVAKLTALGLGYGILPSRVTLPYKHLKRLSDAPMYKDEICLIYRPEKHNNSVSKRIIV